MKFDFHWGIKIPLRDGIHLNGTLYTPKDLRSPMPCIVTLTPYICDSYHQRGAHFAAAGLPFLIVDVRGRGNSEGIFRPFIQEAQDGYDVVEWLAHQPYCNGKVAMWGGSYAGYAQWATAKESPPHLATIVPSAASYMGVDFPMRNNIFYPFLIQWLLLTGGRASQLQIYSDAAFWSTIYRHWHESGQPFRDLDAVLGHPNPIFQEWLSHPEPDAYWDAHNPSTEQYARLQIPILTITGSYDDTQSSAIGHYRESVLAALPAARMRHYLVIGPWNHAATGAPCAEFGGIKCGSDSVIDMVKLHLDWYAWTLQNGPKPDFLKKPVAYYVTGAEHWSYAETLEDVTAGYETLFLDSVSNADDVFSAGTLKTIPGIGQQDTYTYNPGDTSGPEVDAEARADELSLVDQSLTLALNGKQLVYHSEPFANDVEVSGFFRLSVWIAIDCPDTDLYASIHEISHNGDSVRLSTDAIRARYREGLRTAKLIRTRMPLRYDFERFTFVSREIRRGHRLRLVIASMGRLVETTFAEKNYNHGGIVAEESMKDARPVTVSLFHDADHPSVLHVPLGQCHKSMALR